MVDSSWRLGTNLRQVRALRQLFSNKKAIFFKNAIMS